MGTSRSARELTERLRRKFPRMLAAMEKAAADTIAASATAVVAKQKGYAPVDDGDLKASIGFTMGEYRPSHPNVRGISSKTSKSGKTGATIFAGDEKAFYAAFVEFGTAPHRNGGRFAGTMHPGSLPHPFFWPAWRLLKSGIKRKMTKAIKDAAVKTAGRD